MQSGKVADRGLVVADGEPAPLLDLVDAAVHRVAVAAEPCAMGDGFPAPLRPFFFRLAAWSTFSGITSRILRLRR
jgi:hypothetical protein